MKITNMTQEDFKNIPLAEWDENIGNFNSLVIIPTGEMHDSGYMCMEFVAVDDNNEPIKRMSGCSDVIHIDGIGGFGKWKESGEIPKAIPPKRWSIDCLPCGYLRLFSGCINGLSHGLAVSDFELYAEVTI